MQTKTHENSEIVQRVLSSKDRAYSHLLLSSVNVALFKYEGEWKNMEVEGAIHVYKRREVPSTAILILNRKSPKDFHMAIDKHIHSIENHSRFLIVKRAVEKEMEIYGFWFYDAHSCIETGFILADQLSLLKRSKDLLKKCKEITQSTSAVANRETAAPDKNTPPGSHRAGYL